MKKALFLFFLAIAGCSTPTPYQAADKRGNGFSDTKIQSERYRVSFRGNEVTKRETVENYLLYRAAEITLNQGDDYFVVDDKETEADVRYSTSGPSLYGGSGIGRRGFGGLGFGWNQSTTASKKYEAIIYITTHKGTPPKENPKAFSAAELKSNLEGKIIRK